MANLITEFFFPKQNPTPFAPSVKAAINSTATATADQIATKYITSTSGAAVSITTPTAAQIAAALKLTPADGLEFDLTIDNSAGSNTVTLVLDASIAVVTPAITGGATLTVSTANKIGRFKIIYTSSTAAKIFRVF